MTIRKAWDAYRAQPVAVYGTMIALYLLARVIHVAGGEVLQTLDSAVYAYRDDAARNQGPLISLIGQAPRPWGLPVFYALFPDDQWRAIGQTVLGALAWIVFAWELTRHLRTQPARYALFG